MKKSFSITILSLVTFIIGGCDIITPSSNPNSNFESDIESYSEKLTSDEESSFSSLPDSSKSSAKESSKSSSNSSSAPRPSSSSLDPNIDPDDLWVEPGAEGGKDTNLPEKSGETYAKYSYKPIVGTKIPEITVTLKPESNGRVPNLENTYLTTARIGNKGDYYGCTVTVSNYDGEDVGIVDTDCQIKVRGNYTVNYSKKPFRLKFDKKQKMPGFEGKYKSWVLLADVKDHSMMRNALSFYMGKVLLGSDGHYSSNFRPVELYFVDGTNQRRYWGSYLLAEQQEIKEGRIDITDVSKMVGSDGQEGSYEGTDIGYLLEFDGYYNQGDDPNFSISYNNSASYRIISGGTNRPSQRGFTVKGDLSTANNRNQLNFISSYMENVYRILYEATYNNTAYKFNDTYTSISVDRSLTGEQAIRNVIDVNSLVDSYIISEVSCDPDVAWSSFYMDVDFGANAKNHLLTFEAPWDFDSCYAVRSGNYCTSGTGYYAATSANPWLSVALNNEWFFNLVKAKYQELYKYELLKDFIEFLDNTSQMQIYKDMYARNFDKWGTNDETHEVRSELANLRTQAEHCAALSDWLHTRFNWLSTTWLEGYDVVTHEKTTGGTVSEGNVALLTNGKKYRYEAENAVYTGSISPRVNRPETNASNDSYLGNVSGTNGETITFTVKATQHKQAYLVVCISQSGTDVNFNNMFEVKVNGNVVKVRDVMVPGLSNYTWHDWYEVRVNSFWLNAGNNTIILTTKGSAPNFDYIDIYSKDTLS